METQIEQLDGGRVRLTVEVPSHDVQHAVEHATHDLSERVKIPGFRPGKVPPKVLASRIGKDRIYAEAVESHLSSWFWSAARRTRVRPTESPDFEYDLPTTDEDDWKFTAEFPVQAIPVPADWTALEVPKLEVEVEQEVVDGQLEGLQHMVAELSPVEGRPAREGDVAVIDIITDAGTGQRDYVLELGGERVVDEIEGRVRDLVPGESQQVTWDDSNRQATVTLKQLFERVLPPLDDEFARSASEFDKVDELRGDIESRIRKLLEDEADNQFRAAAVDELVKASKVAPAGLVVEVRTRELINSFLRQLESRGVDPSSYLRMMGLTGADLEQRLRVEAANSIARELVLEAVADKLGIEVTDDDIRADLLAEGESEEDIAEFFEAGGADRVRPDLRMKRAVDRIAAEVKPIAKELAEARESIWTPDKEAAAAPEKTLWTPGSSKD